MPGAGGLPAQAVAAVWARQIVLGASGGQPLCRIQRWSPAICMAQAGDGQELWSNFHRWLQVEASSWWRTLGELTRCPGLDGSRDSHSGRASQHWHGPYQVGLGPSPSPSLPRGLQFRHYSLPVQFKCKRGGPKRTKLGVQGRSGCERQPLAVIQIDWSRGPHSSGFVINDVKTPRQ